MPWRLGGRVGSAAAASAAAASAAAGWLERLGRLGRLAPHLSQLRRLPWGARVGSASFRFGGSLEGGARRVGYVPLRRQPSGGRAAIASFRFGGSLPGRRAAIASFRFGCARCGLVFASFGRSAGLACSGVGSVRFGFAVRPVPPPCARCALCPFLSPLCPALACSPALHSATAALPPLQAAAYAPLRYRRTAPLQAAAYAPLRRPYALPPSRQPPTLLSAAPPHCPPPGSRLRSTPPPLRTAPLQAAAEAERSRPDVRPPAAADGCGAARRAAELPPQCHSIH